MNTTLSVTNTSFHTMNLESFSTKTTLTIDGTLEATNTSNTPTAKLQPEFFQRTLSTGARKGRIRYLEVYNK